MSAAVEVAEADARDGEGNGGSQGSKVGGLPGYVQTAGLEIEASDLVDLSQLHCQNTCYRSGDDKPVEFTLMFNVDKIKALDFPDAGAPPQQFLYRKDGEAPAGRPSAGIDLKMETYKIGWTWNAKTGLYERSQNGKPDKDRSGEQVTTSNVVVLVMTYNPGISNSPDAVSVGTGEAWVHSGGSVVHGTWKRTDRTQTFTLIDDDGNHEYDLVEGDMLFIPAGMYHASTPITPRVGLSIGLDYDKPAPVDPVG